MLFNFYTLHFNFGKAQALPAFFAKIQQSRKHMLTHMLTRNEVTKCFEALISSLRLPQERTAKVPSAGLRAC